MDNFDNRYYGDAPQKPFTEKHTPPAEHAAPQAFPQQMAPQSFDFEPERPLVQQPVQPQPAQPEPFNPVQHTAVYQNGTFMPPEPPQPQRGFVYNNQYGQPPVPPQNAYRPPMGGNVYAPQVPPQPVQPQPAQPRKGNKGLIAVIIVLSVLLAGSLAGLLGYVLMNSGDGKAASSNDNSNHFEIPGFTLPDNNGGNGHSLLQPSTEAPVHEESDYSDKVISDYDGMKLQKKPSDAENNKQYTSEYAFNQISDSVVGIMCYSDKEKTSLKSQGSGMILSQGGYLLTNAHVIGNSKTAYAIKVVTSDGKEYNAGVVGFDSRTDIAVLKMDGAEGLKPATFGDSSQLTIGEDIIIVGNPGGISYQNSMTKGIVSALDRDASDRSIVKYIQTDAAINPGNSGGPAVNLYGQVIGMASSKIASVTYEGMAFCIPSQTVKDIADSLIRKGYVEGRVKIGIAGQAVDLETATYYNVPQGIEVQTIDKNGPCGSTGLAEGDIVTSLDGETITTFSEIYAVLEKHSDGDKVKLGYYQSETGKTVEEEITLAADN